MTRAEKHRRRVEEEGRQGKEVERGKRRTHCARSVRDDRHLRVVLLTVDTDNDGLGVLAVEEGKDQLCKERKEEGKKTNDGAEIMTFFAPAAWTC
jgi:hypothetical protein